MRVSPVELNTSHDVSLHNFASTNRPSLVQLCKTLLRQKTREKLASSRLALSASGPGTFPKANKALLRRRLEFPHAEHEFFKSDISSVCSFVASLRCVTQRGLASPIFIASCEPIREAVTSMLATSRVTNQMRRSIWATRNFTISLSYLTLLSVQTSNFTCAEFNCYFSRLK